MWRLKPPAKEERRNSASVVELRRAQQLAQIRIESERPPSLRRANSCKEKDPDLLPSSSYLKIPQNHHFFANVNKNKRRASSSDTRVHKSRHSPKEGSPRTSPRGSPKTPRSRSGSRGYSSLNFILGNNSKSHKENKDGRSVKDLRYTDVKGSDDNHAEGKKSRRNSPVSSNLVNIPENHKNTECSALVSAIDTSKLASYHSCDYFFKVTL